MKIAIIFLASFAITTVSLAQSTSAPGSVLSASGGRYVFGQISEYRRDQYLLDTLTGRLWVKTCAVPSKEDPKQCAFSALQPVAFSDKNGDLIGFAPSQSSK